MLIVLLSVPTLCVSVPVLRDFSPEVAMISGSLLATSMGPSKDQNLDTLEFKMAVVILGAAMCLLGFIVSMFARALLGDPGWLTVPLAWILILASQLFNLAGVRSVMRGFPMRL